MAQALPPFGRPVTGVPLPTPLPVAIPTQTPQLLPGQMPPKPPEIAYRSGMLLVVADNSTLSAILHGVEKRTGIKLEGTPPEDRLFGRFGPASLRDVLNQLFSGFHIDYILQGSTDPGSVEKITLNNRGAITAQMVGAYKPPRRLAAPVNPVNPETLQEETTDGTTVTGGDSENMEDDPLDQSSGQEMPETQTDPEVDNSNQTQTEQVPAPPTPEQLMDRLRQIQNQQQNH